MRDSTYLVRLRELRWRMQCDTQARERCHIFAEYQFLVFVSVSNGFGVGTAALDSYGLPRPWISARYCSKEGRHAAERNIPADDSAGVLDILCPVARTAAPGSAGRKGKVKPADFKYGESAKVPGEVSIPNRNYMNLLESPVLFYVVCLMFYETRWVDMPVLWLAWAFVAVRVTHSLVHLTYNHVGHRALIFGASNFIAIAMWGLFLVRMYG